MSYVYHSVPEKMIGHNLVPLNIMRQKHHELFTQYSKKYEGRQEILNRHIPLLDCFWSDVVQFSPVHPSKIFELQKSLGLIRKMPIYQYFEIDTKLFNPEKAVVYFKSDYGEENIKFMWLKDIDLSLISEVPQPTIDYYKTFIGTGKLPLNYQFIPHILYAGTIDTSASKIITI